MSLSGEARKCTPAPHLKEKKNGKHQFCKDLRKNTIVALTRYLHGGMSVPSKLDDSVMFFFRCDIPVVFYKLNTKYNYQSKHNKNYCIMLYNYTTSGHIPTLPHVFFYPHRVKHIYRGNLNTPAP